MHAASSIAAVVLFAALTGSASAHADDVVFLDQNRALQPPKAVGAGLGVDANYGADTSSSSSSPQVGTFEVGAGGVSPAGRVFGVGLQIGVPSGVTLKYMATPQVGIVGGLGVGAGWFVGPALSVNVDIVYHPHILVKAQYLVLSWYVGGGAWLGIADYAARPFVYFGDYVRYFGPRFWIAARGVLGVNVALTDLPIEFYLEGNPALVVFPGVSFGLGASLGLRFYL